MARRVQPEEAASALAAGWWAVDLDLGRGVAGWEPEKIGDLEERREETNREGSICKGRWARAREEGERGRGAARKMFPAAGGFKNFSFRDFGFPRDDGRRRAVADGALPRVYYKPSSTPPARLGLAHV